MTRALLALLLHVPAAALAPAAGEILGLWFCDAAEPRQRFAIGAFPSSTAQPIFSQALSSSLVLDVSGPSKATGTAVHVWGQYHPLVPNQQWVASAGGIASAYAAGMCLAAKGPSLAELLGIYPCNATDPLQALAFSAATGQIAFSAAPGLCVQAGNTTASCDMAPFSGYGYCNASLPVAQRVADLVGRMTVAEMAAAMDSGVPAIPRLGVPTMHSGEALHGAACGCAAAPAPGSTGCPTSFPAPIALGAAMDPELWQSVGLAIGTEARALANLGPGALWVFSPNLNPARDPRWGRIQEVRSRAACTPRPLALFNPS